MTDQIPKKLLIVNDIMTGFVGAALAAVTLPGSLVHVRYRLSLCLLCASNHTGFPTYYKGYDRIYADYLKQLDTVVTEFDGIYCGYFGSLMQMHIMEEYITKHRKVSNKKPVIMIDPVMGDHGNAYHSITQIFCQQMQQFIQNSDLLTPNITDDLPLTNTPYHDGFWTESELTTIADILSSM